MAKVVTDCLVSAEMDDFAYAFCRSKLGDHRGWNPESQWTTFIKTTDGKFLYQFYDADDAFLVEFKLRFG